jgi:amino acid adenylation domain-containing protein
VHDRCFQWRRPMGHGLYFWGVADAQSATHAEVLVAIWADSTELLAGFLRSADSFGDRPALSVDGVEISYGRLREHACAIAATLDEEAANDGPPLTGLFAHRTETAFAGVLASLFRGHGYVPLNRTFPVQRTRAMIQRSGVRAIVADARSAEQLPEVLEGLDHEVTVLVPESDDVRTIADAVSPHRILSRSQLAYGAGFEPAPVSDEGIAYLLFTSGSTGTPKGVAVSHRNVRHFIDVMVQRYDINEHDRFSQTFDMTFDLSAFDMFVAWDRGACVCCVPQTELINPGKFIQREELTVWFSVPSMAVFMRRLGALKPNKYPTLRWALFCGEPLPVSVAEVWSGAAPNAIVENLYGPTELTIACTLYRWDPLRSPAESRAGVVPIGHPYPGMQAIVVDEELLEVEPGIDGELLLTGPQVTLGYWQDSERTASAFVVPPHQDATYYRTGDLVRRPFADEPMTYVGRIDQQVKVNGHRVELGEIEHAIRQVSGADAVVAVGWPRSETGASGITAFIGGGVEDAEGVRLSVGRILPDYMVPRRIHAIDELPLNANGKVDRAELVKLLEKST